MQFRFMYTSTDMKTPKIQLGRIVNKVMNFDQTKKSRHKNSSNLLMVSKTSDDVPKISPSTHKNRRVVVLNKIFMKYITDLMTTGEIASKLLGRGVEVTHVKVAPDYKLVNVFWYSSDAEITNKSTEKILKESTGYLQHELSQLRIIGIVPPIQFVKNKYFGQMKEVENRLAKVNFGEDYVPTAYIIENNVSILETSLSEKIKKQLFDLNRENIQKNHIYKIDIPEMKQDVMGFNYSSIMKKIRQSLEKIKNTEKNTGFANLHEVTTSQATDFQTNSFFANNQENHIFEDFLKKRSIEEKQKQKCISLLQVKFEDEKEWDKKITNEQLYEEIDIDDEYKDEYYEIEKYK